MTNRSRRAALLAALATLVLAASLAVAGSATGAGTGSTYLVVYKQQAVPTDAADSIAQAGGTLVYAYDQIGVAIASADSATFASALAQDNRVDGVSATAQFGTRVEDDAVTDAVGDPTPAIPAPGNDTLSGLQWDMTQIHAPEARAINGGSPAVVVGDIDTGLDYTHPDLAANVDFANSVSCVGGVPNTSPSAWMDDNGHGTHTAGTIAAAKNGIGIVGVAPNVRIAGIKAGNADGFFFPEAVICAFVWAGTHNIAVTNNSYFADPWLFNCRNDPGQRAIWKAERRAIDFAQRNGTLVVAAEGNQADDLAHPTQDATSPDDTTPVTRDITNACAVVPTEVSGVVGVTANGNKQLKSFYSSYGVGSADVIAPGGDSVLQVTAAAPNGRVLSTWPASLAGACARKVVDGAAVYCYVQGTSMASPHAAGVAALIASNGVRSPGAIASRLQNTADPIACPPDLSIYAFFPAVDNGAPQVCSGGPGYNSFNGHGQVNALTAVGG
ncbi:MAG TPA: S8 family serine peptidase [Gaiella sp.]|jgi:subtilisin family serine protease|nr:S8 family serine peptidase [Gaiella sp.]